MEMLIRKAPEVSGLVNTTVLIKKIGEVENKIPSISNLIKKSNY